MSDPTDTPSTDGAPDPEEVRDLLGALEASLVAAKADREDAIDWRSHGAKRHGKAGWKITERRHRWMLTVGFIDWGTDSFWRIGLCEPYDGGVEWIEVSHVRCATEREALDTALWLVEVAHA